MSEGVIYMDCGLRVLYMLQRQEESRHIVIVLCQEICLKAHGLRLQEGPETAGGNGLAERVRSVVSSAIQRRRANDEN